MSWCANTRCPSSRRRGAPRAAVQPGAWPEHLKRLKALSAQASEKLASGGTAATSSALPPSTPAAPAAAPVPTTPPRVATPSSTPVSSTAPRHSLTQTASPARPPTPCTAALRGMAAHTVRAAGLSSAAAEPGQQGHTAADAAAGAGVASGPSLSPAIAKQLERLRHLQLHGSALVVDSCMTTG